jgi:Transcriptional regulators
MPGTDFMYDDFAYPGPVTASGSAASATSPIAFSIFADRPHLRATLRDDAQAAGLTVTRVGALSDLTHGSALPLGDVVMIDCPQVDAQALAALARLDLRAARSESRLIVSTSVEALDDVFSCMDQSAPVLLVDPNRAERVIALGQVLSGFAAGRLRELSEGDRLMLLRLSEQVGQLAGRIDRLAPQGGIAAPPVPTAGPLSSTLTAAFPPRQPDADRGAFLAPRSLRPPLPEAHVVRQMIRQRQQRARYFDGDLFADPAWDMLLDLAAARVERKRVSVTSLCIASGVPPTTALRWIGQMVEAGLFVRVCDDSDRRRAFIELTEQAVDAVARYFYDLAPPVAVPV